MWWIPFLGMFVMLGIAWAMSTNRRAINWRTVATGTVLQFAFAVLILRTRGGRAVFAAATDAVSAFLDFTDAGASFIFGEGFGEHFFAFKVLPTIIFFSSVIAVLYHLGIVQKVVKLFAWAMMRLMGTSGSESLSTSANIFVGQTEAPLLVRPYIGAMTNSELMAVMTGGFATIAGGVLAAYVGMGVEAGHLIAASVMSAPAALVMAKIMIPETEESATAGEVKLEVESPYVNLIDAAAEGAAAGLRLALTVGAMLLAFIALVAVVNAFFGKVGGLFGFESLSLEWLLGQLFRPLAWLMGVPWEEADQVGALLGIKTVINEFVGYAEMRRMVAAGELTARSEVIATYALCGFSNFSSIAIQIGGIGGIAPERKSDLARLGLRAMIAGSLACFQTATIAGMLL
ncbi:MAG TPA: NupC/NupG family nucleoside CNT transporter [Thermoanaerobaculia bacterium]|nr:NupC/NupG family nucleoside CNT transporter [Thermoanaerobaculia bacterium]